MYCRSNRDGEVMSDLMVTVQHAVQISLHVTTLVTASHSFRYATHGITVEISLTNYTAVSHVSVCLLEHISVFKTAL